MQNEFLLLMCVKKVPSINSLHFVIFFKNDIILLVLIILPEEVKKYFISSDLRFCRFRIPF